LIISHRGVLRPILGYFKEFPLEKIPFVDIPLHTVIKLTPTPYGCDEQRFDLANLMKNHWLKEHSDQPKKPLENSLSHYF